MNITQDGQITQPMTEPSLALVLWALAQEALAARHRALEGRLGDFSALGRSWAQVEREIQHLDRNR